MTIPQEECQEVTVPVCQEVSRRQCDLVPEETCQEVEQEAGQEARCRTNTRLVCEQRPREQCGTTVSWNREGSHDIMSHITLNSSGVYAARSPPPTAATG